MLSNNWKSFWSLEEIFSPVSTLNKRGKTGAISDILTLNNLVRDGNIWSTLLKINDNTAAAAAFFLEEMSVFPGRNLIVADVLCSGLTVWMIVVVVFFMMSFSSLSSFDLDDV